MKTTNFNANWTCTAYGKTENVTLPHDFMIGSRRSGENKTGADLGYFTPERGIYTKRFTVDEPEGKTFLRFDGVMGLCEVFLNHQAVAFHPYGYTAFLADLTPYLKSGENELSVSADTTAQVASRWYTGGGIYRNVELLTSGADYIVPWGIFVKTLHLHDNSASVEVEVKVNAAKEGRAFLTVTTAGADHLHRVWVDAGENTFIFRYTLENIQPWTPENPAPANNFAMSPATLPASDHVGYMDRGIEYVYFEATNWYAESGNDEVEGTSYTGYIETFDYDKGEHGMFMNTEYDTWENLNTFYPGRAAQHFAIYSPLLTALLLVQ